MNQPALMRMNAIQSCVSELSGSAVYESDGESMAGVAMLLSSSVFPPYMPIPSPP